MEFINRFFVLNRFFALTIITLIAGPLSAQAPKPVAVGVALAKASQAIKPTVSDVWIKTTIPGGAVTAAYMRIQSPVALKLLKVDGTIAGNIQLHEMKMNDGVMEMKALAGVDIAAGKAVELKPGGTHVMMMDVAKSINAGDKIPLQLTFEGADKKKFIVRVEAIARDNNRNTAGKTGAH